MPIPCYGKNSNDNDGIKTCTGIVGYGEIYCCRDPDCPVHGKRNKELGFTYQYTGKATQLKRGDENEC